MRTVNIIAGLAVVLGLALYACSYLTCLRYDWRPVDEPVDLRPDRDNCFGFSTPHNGSYSRGLEADLSWTFANSIARAQQTASGWSPAPASWNC